jgi:indolepyruvate ferredoxin oxidoreductase beta subunit
MKASKPINVVVSGVGGQGVLLATGSVAQAALLADRTVFMGEIHGMSQRGGTVVATVRMGPVTSGMVGEGEATVLLGLEAVETYRMRSYLNESTWVLMNERRIPPLSVSRGDEDYPPSEKLVEALNDLTPRLLTVPALDLAKEAGSRRVENVVALGALSATEALPFSSDQLLDAVLSMVPGAWREVNEQAFALGRDHGLKAIERSIH